MSGYGIGSTLVPTFWFRLQAEPESRGSWCDTPGVKRLHPTRLA